MVRERKCILCHIVYSSKKEMDEHMRSMLHHRELENLRGRDCSHECRVCQVTVVGLSAYAKHISSQLHKDNVDAQEKEEEKEEAEEEYFDKELIQLINQRKEQSRQDEVCNSSKEKDPDRYQRRRDDRLSFQDMGPQEWRHCDPSERDWKWQNECFKNSRQGNFQHPPRSLNPNRHLNGPRGRAGWHLNGPSNRHLIHGKVGGSWHSNAGGPTSWHHRGTGRNFHWHQEESGGFSNSHPRNCGGNWQLNPYNANLWNFGGTVDAFPQGRNRPLRHCDSVQEKEPAWNKKNGTSNKFAPERFTWVKADNKNSNGTQYLNSDSNSSEKAEDFTSDGLPADKLFGFKTSEKLDKSTKTNPPFCPGKNSSPSRDKPHRWAPYPSQKGSDIQQTLPQTDLPYQPAEATKKDPKTDQAQNLTKPKMRDDMDMPDTCDDHTDGKKADEGEPKCTRMPSLKSPLRSVPDMKSFAFKREQKNHLKGVKLLFPLSPGERQNRLSALNLETVRSNSYISKLRSSSRNMKINQDAQETSQKEPVETLSEVLRKAKEMLQNSQSIQSPYFHPMKAASINQETITVEPSKDSTKADDSTEDPLEDVSDGDLSDNGTKVVHSMGSIGGSACDTNCELAADYAGNTAISFEQVSTNSDADTIPMESMGESIISQPNSEPLDEQSNGITQCQDYHDIESFENVSDFELQKGANPTSNPFLPEFSKLGLPASLQRDLTRHIGSRSKTGTHLPEPNLNSARRVRNVSGHRKSETDKDSGLRPTLRQFLNASRRNINWEQVIQHVTKKKQELGKGLPRFGIEMVAQVQSEQEGLDFDETVLSIESFNWEGIAANLPGSTRKRSLSESSVAVERASVYDMFNDHGSEAGGERSIPSSQSPWATSGPNVSFTLTPSLKQEGDDVPVSFPALENVTTLSGLLPADASESQNGDLQSCTTSDSPCLFHSTSEDIVVVSVGNGSTASPHVDAGSDSCTSGTEQNDGQGAGKKRRATGDGSCPDIPSLERKNKRRKIRGKKERFQVDQLLNISLREEELNNSLQGVDSNLLQARTALQAAYLDVQRLLVLKQQITMEMSTMRTQRIQILQGLQGTYEPVSNTTEERNSRSQINSDASPGHLFSLLAESPPYLSPHASPAITILPAPLSSPAFQPLTVAPAVPDSSIPIKQEPMSPERGEENMITTALSCVQPVRSPQTNGEVDQTTSVYPIITATMSLSELTHRFPLLSAEPSPDMSQNISPPLFRSPVNIKQESISSQRYPNSFHGQALPLKVPQEETNNCSAGPLKEQQAESTHITVETKAGKKKKLRKKKSLRATHVPENSDTEQDIDACKPIRKNRGWRLSKETTVSTSTSLEQEHEATAQETERTKDDNDSDCNVEVVEIPNPQFVVVAIDSHSGDEKPDSPSKMDLVRTREETSEVNDEVTSTSELGTNYVEESLRSMVEDRRASLRGSKNSSEVSSEPGEDEEPTEGTFEGHHAAVNAIQIFGGLLYTCSADKTVRVYNLVTRQCVGIFEGHTSKVNCLLVAQTQGKIATLFTGSSDHTIRCYSIKSQECVDQLKLGERVLCLHVRWKILYAGLANGTVVTFALKNNKQIDMFECHGPRAVSCLATAQEGARRLLLVGSYDCTISVRDARNGLLLRTLEGHTKTVLCMKVVNDLVFSGSSDQSVHAHNIHTGELVRIYKGHNHAVTVVNILGKVMVTACLDKFVRVYELQSHDRLQVYGGHSDMIMCMAIHKSMIYTGCYDGSIQAVRLNLMQNYRCWWHGCSLIFGVADHLKQHLLTDHTNPNFQTLKCRWKNCDAFFTARRSSKQGAVGHIERHAEEDSRIDS